MGSHLAVLGNTNQNRIEQGDLLLNKRKACSPPDTIHKRKQSQRVINDLGNVDPIPSNVKSSRQEALLYVVENNEAVIKMIIKGRSQDMFPGLTELLLTGCLIEFGPQNPNQIH